MTTPGGDHSGVVVTAREMYDLLVLLRSEVQEMTAPLKAVADHESRLRALERWRYALPASLLMALGSVAAAIWGH